MRRFGIFCAVLGAMAVAAPAAQAQFGIEAFDARVLDGPDGAPGTSTYDQAGGHPYVGITEFSFRRVGGGATGPPEGLVRNIRVDVPAGLMSNPESLPRCTDLQMDTVGCPDDTQLGVEQLRAVLDTALGQIELELVLPLYNMTTDDQPDPQVARFSFDPSEAAVVPGLGSVPVLGPALVARLLSLHPVDIVGGVRWQSDYGLFFTITDAPTTTPVVYSKLSFWGTPAAAANTPERGRSCVAVVGLLPQMCGGGGQPSAADPIPFLTNPTECAGVPLETRLTVESYDGATDAVSDFTLPAQNGGEGPQNCAAVPFNGALDVVPNVAMLDAPTGPLVELSTSQAGLLDPDSIAPSQIRNVEVRLPPGLTLNPSVANGLEACTDAQLGKGTSAPVACPAASEIGTVAVDTPLLAQPLRGSAYVGQPLAGDRYRLFLAAAGNGVSLRLVGSVRPDPVTGQITAVFPDNPRAPFDSLSVDLRDGPRAPLATPLECGAKTSTAQYTAYSGAPPVTPSSVFVFGGPDCQPVGFQTLFSAATASPGSGQFSPLSVRIGRNDRNQFLSTVRVDAPPGLAAKIKGVPQCSGAAASTGACPAASRIGTATTSAGAGSEPYQLSGPVYFTEGYKGAPFGMVAVIRAIAGPYDLGTVVVRQALHVDPEDASVTVISDPLPQILEGVPIRLRSVEVTLDRSGFTYNPTSCGTKEVGGRMHSSQGTVGEHPNAFIDFSGCQRLGFTPRMRMQLTGPRQLRVGKHPGLRVRVTQRATQANIASAVVSLPKSLALDPENAQAICGVEAAKRADCPRSTRIGFATAISPVLNRKLSGPVYFVQGIRVDPNTGATIRTLPNLLVKLNGEVRINLRGTTDVRRNRLVSTFASVPDAPVTRFDLRLKGGKGGVLAATGRPRICGRRQIALARVVGHNGKRTSQRRVRMATAKPCRKFRRIQQRAKKRKAAQERRQVSRRAES